MMYMEKILKSKVKGVVLDTKSLRRMADAIAIEESDDHIDLCSDDEGDHAIEEEMCTIDPIKDTTTRLCIHTVMQNSVDA